MCAHYSELYIKRVCLSLVFVDSTINPSSGWFKVSSIRRVEVFRYNSAFDELPHFDQFEVETYENSTVLDTLFTIVENSDSDISFRCSCRLGMCGSCAMLINGREGLACRTKMHQLSDPVVIRPLRNLPIIKDLTVNMDPFFEKWESIKPYFIASEQLDHSTFANIPSSSDRRGIIDQSLDCITCGACWSACTIVALDEDYIGPAALNRAYTLIEDERDGGHDTRMDVAAGEHGAERCHTLFNCMEVCPKHLKPTWAIQKIKSKAVRTGER